MKRLFLMMCIAVLALAQTPTRHGEWVMTAFRLENTAAVTHLTGQVVIETDAMILRGGRSEC
jgi:hypothetical protein